uniref:Secreted protein n=1 Tax=Arundo donax TaxID=35708 RepID=A0A0A9CLU9_ARUDO
MFHMSRHCSLRWLCIWIQCVVGVVTRVQPILEAQENVNYYPVIGIREQKDNQRVTCLQECQDIYYFHINSVVKLPLHSSVNLPLRLRLWFSSQNSFQIISLSSKLNNPWIQFRTTECRSVNLCAKTVD